MEPDIGSQLRRVCDVVTVARSAGGTEYHGQYWEDDAVLEIAIRPDEQVAEVTIARGTAVERFRVCPLGRVEARTARRPHRLDLGKSYGGRLTIWFKPFGYPIGGSPEVPAEPDAGRLRPAPALPGEAGQTL